MPTDPSSTVLLYNDSYMALKPLKETEKCTIFKFLNPEVCEKVIAGEKVEPPDDKPLIFNFARSEQKIQSFCYTCTKELKTELAVSIYSLRQFHHQPIFALVDQETKEHLEKFNFSKIHIKVGADKEHLQEELDALGKTYDDLKTFHRKECIAKKMDAMDWALERHDNTFFLDSDIIVIDDLQENFTSDVCISPHFHEQDEEGRALDKRVGTYNAGYVFCSNKQFPKWWKDNFYNKSKFYEQECMNRIPDYFSTQCFSKEHNLGFWRKGFGYINDDVIIDFEIKSFHLHLTTIFDDRQPESLKEKNVNLRVFFEKYLKKNDMSNLYDEIMSISKDEPLEIVKTKSEKKKAVFVHYGKAGGVYVNNYLRAYLMKGAREINSWNCKGENLKRDWSEEELLSFIDQESFQSTWVHNHHINWTKKAIQKYNEKDWFTFTFIRKPEEILCSLWNYIRAGEKGHDAFGVLYDISLKSLDEFIGTLLCLDDSYVNMKNLWVLPDYIDELDYVAEMNDKNFGHFCEKYFGHDYIPQRRRNESANKGYQFYRDSGEISDKTHEKLMIHPEYIRYKKYLDE